MTKWEPIETALEDPDVFMGKKDVLVWVVGEFHAIPAYYISKEYLIEEYDDPNYMETGWYPSCGFMFDLPEVTLDATHWKPADKGPK